MSDGISYYSSELEIGGDLNGLIREIGEYQKQRQQENELTLRQGILIEEFFSRLDHLQDFYYQTTSTITKYGLRNHQYLWLESLECLASVLLRFESFFIDNYIEEESSDEPQNYLIQVTKAAVLFGRLIGTGCDLVGKYLVHRALSLGRLFKSGSLSSYVINKLMGLVRKVLLVIDLECELLLQNIPNIDLTLRLIGQFLHQFYDEVGKQGEITANDITIDSFTMLTDFIQAAYTTGNSSLIQPFVWNDKKHPRSSINVIHPEFPLKVLKRNAASFPCLLTYFKYTAFALTTLSLNDEVKISHGYNVLADVYYKALLNLPTQRNFEKFEVSTDALYKLQSPYYTQTEFQPEKKTWLTSKSLLERQEISLLFILNYLLKLTNLKQVTNPDNYFQLELSFLTNSLSASISQDIHRSTSRLGSVSSSTASSFAQLSLLATPMTPQQHEAQYKSLSAILLHGSYKEKLFLIIQICENVQKDPKNLCSIIETSNDEYTMENDFQHSVSIIDKAKYPGKMLYISALVRIARLLKVIGIKHLVSSCGFNNVPESYLNALFVSKEPVRVSARVKDLLDFSVHLNAGNENVLLFNGCSRPSQINDDNDLRQHAEILRITDEIDKLTDRLR